MLQFQQVKYICLDEADRLLDIGFEDDVRQVYGYLSPTQPRQNVLFSATLPAKVQYFAKECLARPILVNVGRAGAANLNVVQEVEFVKPEDRLKKILEALQKTPPPVLIFCENKSDVDEIHEFLLIKGIDACAIHGGKEQQERELAVKQFRKGEKDVLVATDVVGKGLDFPDIKHVINFEMPKEIETYVHHIGRTGRGSKTGLATTFIHKLHQNESVLLDLKHLLLEAKQNVPPILMQLHNPLEDELGVEHGGCKYCSGLGHRTINCPKLERDRQEQMKQLGLSSGY
jgi:ATP-dependent RNA helicase DDX41